MSAPHLAVPFTLAIDGSAATVEQDTADDIANCVRTLLSTPTGARLAVPDYGVVDPTFAGVNEAEIAAAVTEWEPRADITVTTDPTDPSQVTVSVREVQ